MRSQGVSRDLVIVLFLRTWQDRVMMEILHLFFAGNHYDQFLVSSEDIIK
jgi:hypothetical protein